jgi:hypothetical protein
VENIENSLAKRLDARLGIALTRFGNQESASLAENIKFVRGMDFTNKEIATILGKSVHHVEVEASKLVRQGKLKKQKGV